MDSINFIDLYEFLSIELGVPSGELHALAAAPDGEERLGALAHGVFQSAGLLVLAEGFGTPGGQQTLLNAGADLGARIDAVVKRQVKNPDARLGPVVLAAGDDTVARYKGKVLAMLAPVLENVTPASDPMLQRFYRSLGEQEAGLVATRLRAGIDQALTTSAGLGHLLRATRDPTSASVWERSVASALVCSAMAKSWSRERSAEPRPDHSEALSLAALFQDLSLLLFPSLEGEGPARHAVRSGQLVREMGFGADVGYYAERHHQLLVDDGEDEDLLPPVEEGLPERAAAALLVVANLFVSSAWGETEGNKDIEAIKGLHFLSADRVVERSPVVTLTRLYLSKRLAFYMEKAEELARKCTHPKDVLPVLWNIVNHRPPQKIICSHAHCDQLGSQITWVAQPISVNFDGRVLGEVHKGEYLSCRLLTTELEKLFKEIAAIEAK